MLLFIEKDSPENPTWETELIPRERWSLKLRERNWRDREGLYRESSGVWFLDRERGEICQRERGGGGSGSKTQPIKQCDILFEHANEKYCFNIQNYLFFYLYI